MLVRDVVRDDVDDRADAERAGLRDQLLGLLERPERRVDRAVVGDVVARVGQRRRVPGVEPEGVDAEVAQVRQPRADAGEVADPVAVRVGEAADVDLVDDGVAPPAAVATGSSAGAVLGLAAERSSSSAGFTRRASHIRQSNARDRQIIARSDLDCRIVDRRLAELAALARSAASDADGEPDGRGRGRAASDDLGLEEELLGRDGRALDLARQHRDRRAADRLDRLADGRQRRVGAAHERRVVVADDGDVGGDREARRGGRRGSRRARAGRSRR